MVDGYLQYKIEAIDTITMMYHRAIYLISLLRITAQPPLSFQQ
jgi:hypothetical protein